MLSMNLIAFGQFNFHIDTTYFKGETISHVSLGADNNVWVIKSFDQRGIGKINRFAQAEDLSAIFQASTKSYFTDIAGTDSNAVCVGTYNDFTFKYNDDGFEKIDKKYGLKNKNVNSLLYIHKGSNLFLRHGIVVGTDSGLFVSDDMKLLSSRGRLGSGTWDTNRRYIARYISEYTFVCETGLTSPEITPFFTDNWKVRVFQGTTNYGDENYNNLNSGAKKESINSVVLLKNSSVAGNPENWLFYFGTDTGFTKRRFLRRNSTHENYLPHLKINKLYDINYFPFDEYYRDRYLFIGTDSGLYYARTNSLGRDSIIKIPHTGNLKIHDIDGNVCDNSLWLATDKGLVRLLLNYDINKSFKRIKRSIYPEGDTAICKNEILTLHGFGSDYYQWQRNNQDIPGATANYYSVDTVGTYQLVQTNKFCNYTLSDTTPAKKVFIDSVSLFSFKYPDTLTLCTGKSQKLLVSIPFTKYKLKSWYKDNILFQDNENPIHVDKTGWYKASVINCNNIATMSDSVYINIVEIPKPSIFAEQHVLCEGSPHQLKTDSLPYNIFWYKNADTIPIYNNRAAITIENSGLYSVSYKDKNLCSNKNSTDSLIFYPLPELTIEKSKSGPLCLGDSMLLTVNTSALIVKWGRGDTTQSIVVKNGAEYTVSVFSNEGCKTEKKILLPEVESPKIDLGNDTIFCEGKIIPIVLEVPHLYEKYEWNGVSSDKNKYPAFNQGRHVLKVSDSNGCVGKDSIFIKSYCPPFFFPNLITPNGDGSNEAFEIKNLLPECEMQIFNNWGAKVFSASNYQNEFDGEGLSDGLYYYNFYSSYYRKNWNGWVQIVR